MIDIIIDLETLGTRPGCPIIEIGACAVDPASGRIIGNFSRRVRQPPNMNIRWVRSIADGRILARDDIRETCRWWLEPEAPERAETLRRILGGGVPLRVALIDLLAWIERARCVPDGPGQRKAKVWANGPSFDTAFLAEAYAAAGVPRPWVCYDERCVRTALDQAGYQRGSVLWTERGPRHRALCDARHEAKKLWLSGALGEASAAIRRLRQRGTVPLTAVNADGSVCIPSEEARP